MNRKLTLFASSLLILAGIIIQMLIKDSSTSLDTEIIEFLSGLMVGAGIGLPVYLFFRKRKD